MNWGLFATVLASLGIVLPLLNDFSLLGIKSEKLKKSVRLFIVLVSVISLPVIWNEHYDSESYQNATESKLNSFQEENKLLKDRIKGLHDLNIVSEKRISLLNMENEALRKKIQTIDETISTMSIEYEVVLKLNTNRIIYSPSLIIGPDTPYAILNSSIKLVSSGVSFSFTDFGNNFLVFKCRAEVKNGDAPISQRKDYLKKIKYVQFLVPFLAVYNLTDAERVVSIQSLRMSFLINGFRTKEIIQGYNNHSRNISNSIFQSKSENFLNFDHWFKTNLYEEMILVTKHGK